MLDREAQNGAYVRSYEVFLRKVEGNALLFRSSPDIGKHPYFRVGPKILRRDYRATSLAVVLKTVLRSLALVELVYRLDSAAPLAMLVVDK